ncbi:MULTISPECIES: peptidylprolyl isomerase [Crateriforma]|nr:MULTISPECIES: peptidylprolyl isomerase [Crateriforma]
MFSRNPAARSVMTASFVVGQATLLCWLAASAAAQGPTPEQMRELASIQLPDDPAAVLAVVGKSPILAGEVLPKVDAKIREVTAKTGQPIPEPQLKIARVNLVRGELARAIQFKMMRESFVLDQVGTEAADKREEAQQRLAAKARQYFFEEQLPKLKEQFGTEDMAELEAKLGEQGSSLKAQRREFIDQMLGQLYVSSKLDRDPNVPIADIVRFYNQHRDEYERSAEARWEQLTVRFDRFDNRDAALEAIRAMGTEAYYGGSMQAVAREKSQEPFAADGGVHEWTPQGSLRSSVLDKQIFSLPLNKMSPIIEDDEGLHIVRVLERRDAGVTPLADVQDDIKKKLQNKIVAEKQEQLIKELSQRVPVWSIFPKDTPGALPLPGTTGMLR